MFLEVSNLRFRYGGSQGLTIKDFSMSAAQGAVVAILGASGSGKSTVLRLIAGLEVPESGSIVVDGRTVVSRDTFVAPERRGVGMVFQDYALFPHMTVAANIAFGLSKRAPKDRARRISEVLRLVGLEKYRRRYPHQLSGGQQQRVALARALAPEPSVLLLDEPFSNLDADSRSRIRDELHEILVATGMTSILVTHDQEDARNMADQVIIVEEGRVTQEGDPLVVLPAI